MSEELEYKAKFAKLLLRKTPFEAAIDLCPDNRNWALRIANEWPNDPEVKQMKEELLGSDGLEALPTKGEFCQDLWDKMHGNHIMMEDYLKGMKLYADARSFIDKPGTNINVGDTNIQQNVMLIPDMSDDEWEKGMLAQQRVLMDVSSD